MPNQQIPDNLILCLPPSKPAAFPVNSTNFGLPRGTHGRHNYSIQAVLITCVDFSPEEYIARACREFKLRGMKPDAITSHVYISDDGAQYEAVFDEDVAWGFPEFLTTPTPDTTRFNWKPINDRPNVDPDYYLYHIFIPGKRRNPNDPCINCGCEVTPLDRMGEIGLIRRLAWLSATYNIPLDVDHFQFRQNVDPLAEGECHCADVEALLCMARDYCERPEFMDDPHFELGTLFYVYGVDRYGRLVKEKASDFFARMSA